MIALLAVLLSQTPPPVTVQDPFGTNKAKVVGTSGGALQVSCVGGTCGGGGTTQGLNSDGGYPWTVNLEKVGGNPVVTGTGTGGLGIPRVTVSSDSSTIATQSTASNLNAQVQGAAASGAAKSGNPVQVGGVFNTTQPTVTNGQAVEAQATARGAVIVASGVDAVAVNNTQQGTASQNVAQFGGTNVSTGTGAGGAGIPRVTISNDSSLAANQSVNVAQIAGSTTSTAATGVQKVGVVGSAGAAVDGVIGAATAPANMVVTGGVFNSTLPSPTTGQSTAVQLNAKGEVLSQLSDGTTNVTVIAATNALKEDLASVAGTATATAAAGVQKVGIVGNANAAIDAANNAAAPANVIVDGFETQSSALGTSATAGNVRRGVVGLDGVIHVREGGPLLFTGGVTAIAASLTQVVAAPAASTSLYLTDVMVMSDTATAGNFLIRYGTGSNCATGTTSIFPSAVTAVKPMYPGNASAALVLNFHTPLKIPAANALCILCVATNTCTAQFWGYTAP